MAARQPSSLLPFLRRLVAPAGETDADLLCRFLGQRDEAAFTALVLRHGPMVYGVCLRVLRDVHDAEDAFQATFLVLARGARSVTKRDSLASWLHGVAYRTALKARAGLAKRRGQERQVPAVTAEEPTPAVVWADLRPVLDEEVRRLPEKYRAPFILCYLEGKTNEEAARLVGCPKGTVLSRLATARQRLRARLTRRGIALSAGLLAAALSEGVASAVMPPLLIAPTVKAAAGGSPVLSAGEMFFRLSVSSVEAVEVTNQSTGYCPEPESWPAVASALDALGIAHPGRFTQEVVFRRCPTCGERNVVKDGWYVCGMCGAGLPADWNFSAVT
jgi:RNA polymerase sigma factor (sigma-70 family)